MINETYCSWCGSPIELGYGYIQIDNGEVFCSYECFEGFACKHLGAQARFLGEEKEKPMTVYVLYIVTEQDTDIKGVYSTKERAEEERKQIRKRLAELGNRRFVSVMIDEVEMSF